MFIEFDNEYQKAPLERHRNSMANTYTQIYVHIVFAVEGRQSTIPRDKKEELHKYIAGIVTHQKQKLIAINSLPDHIHILIGQRPEMALSDLVSYVKTGSTNHINRSRWVNGRFSWQQGFGAFSYSHSQLGAVIRYIQNQERHHARKSFRDEYLALLDRFAVPHDERYIFKPVE
jgi:putative transposase